MLDKKGNSNTTERIEWLKDFYQLFPDAKVAYLTADREFLGHDWFEYLLNQALLPFRIRIRESDKLEDGRQSLRGRFKSFKGSNLSYPSDHDTDHRQINKCLGCLWQ